MIGSHLDITSVREKHQDHQGNNADNEKLAPIELEHGISAPREAGQARRARLSAGQSPRPTPERSGQVRRRGGRGAGGLAAGAARQDDRLEAVVGRREAVLVALAPE